MTLMSLFRPLTPAELVQWTLRIYARHWTQWILLAILTVVPLVIANQAIAAVAPIPDVSPAVLNEVFGALEQGTMPSEQSMSQVSDFSMASLQQAALSVLAQVVIVGVVAGGAGAVLTSAAYHGQEASLGQALHTGLVERGGLLAQEKG